MCFFFIIGSYSFLDRKSSSSDEETVERVRSVDPNQTTPGGYHRFAHSLLNVRRSK